MRLTKIIVQHHPRAAYSHHMHRESTQKKITQNIWFKQHIISYKIEGTHQDNCTGPPRAPYSQLPTATHSSPKLDER